MRYKIMMLAILLVSLLAISAVSAADNVTSDVVGMEETTDEVVSVENDNQVISVNESDVGTFDDLTKEINAVEEGGVLNLTKDYKYVNGSNEGIQINKAMTIDGNGHTLDGCQASRIFDVTASNVLLKNINFKNCFVGSNVEGGVIKINGNNISIVNSTFMNCHVSAFDGHVSGGIINCMGEKFSIIGSQFINCSASLTSDNTNFEAYISGGIIWVSGINTTISQTSFINCSSSGDLINLIVWKRGNEGGYWLNPEDANFLYESRFINCSAETIFYSLGRSYVTCSTFMDNKGLLIDSKRSIISKSKFINSDGGIKIHESESIISESSFINSTGNVIFLDRCDNNLLINLEFINSYVSSSDSISGGVVHCWGSNSSIINSSFINCSMSSSSHINGGIVYISGSNSSISESSFINCSMSSSSYINGGIVHIWGSNSSISGSSFINCPIISNSQNEGGVLYLNGYSHQIANSVFKNVRISSVGSLGYIDGGVVLFRGNGINSILNSNFTDCKSTSGLTSPISGGVVSAGYCNITVAGSNFINCSAIVNEGDNLAGGIITISGFSTYFNITQSSFINCYSECTGFEDGSNIIGGVIQSGRTSLNSISKSRFVNCTAQIDSSTYYVSGVIDLSGDENMIADSVFENCNLKGTSSGLSSLLTVDGSSSYSVLDSSFDGCGGYNILIDAKYKNCTINNCPTIKIVDISVKNLNAVYDSGVKCMITVSENYAPAKDVSVVVSINGKKFTTIQTDSKGVASFKISQAPGTYKLTLTASGKSVSKTMTVKKATPKLTANAKSFKKSVKTKKYTVTLKTNQNKVMKNTKVTLKVNGKTYSATTNAKGQATFKITKLTKKGKFTAVVKFAGNKYYNAKTVKPKITIK